GYGGAYDHERLCWGAHAGLAPAGELLLPGRPRDSQHARRDRVATRRRREAEAAAALEPKAGRVDRGEGVTVCMAAAHEPGSDRVGPPLPAREPRSPGPHVLVEAKLATRASTRRNSASAAPWSGTEQS